MDILDGDYVETVDGAFIIPGYTLYLDEHGGGGWAWREDKTDLSGESGAIDDTATLSRILQDARRQQ
jgi:hypothetical protein